MTVIDPHVAFTLTVNSGFERTPFSSSRFASYTALLESLLDMVMPSGSVTDAKNVKTNSKEFITK